MRNRALSHLLPLSAAALLLAPTASAVDVEWVAIGNPGNAADSMSNCQAASCGSVSYSYFISKYEVTNAQYAEFLNAKAATDTNGLYNTSMGSDAIFGGITRSGSSGSYTYSVKTGFADKPVVYVSFYDALRFANWLDNGQGSSDTETGAYTITPAGISANTIARNALATRFLPSENEWYKAAYYSPGGVYFNFPAGTDADTGCVAPGSDTGNSANCDLQLFALTDVGAYSQSESPYGTYDQGGNVNEWNEQIVPVASRGARGGSWGSFFFSLSVAGPSFGNPTDETSSTGFRVASLVGAPPPVPIGDVAGPAAAALLLTTGLLALAYWQSRQGHAARTR